MASVVTMARQWGRGASDVVKSAACVFGAALGAGVAFWVLAAVFAALGFAVAGLLQHSN